MIKKKYLYPVIGLKIKKKKKKYISINLNLKYLLF